MQNALKYFKENEKNYLDDLKSLCSIPTISADGFPKEKVREGAEATAELLRKAGLEKVELLEIDGAHPYVYGEWMGAKGKPTVILYAHYDVQPAGDLSEWEFDPFTPTEKGDRLFGRGTGDDKAGILVHLSAISSYLKTAGALPVNVKCLFEGEEEIGSPNLGKCLKTYKNMLQADIVVLTDTENMPKGGPAITNQLRGIVTCDIEISVLKKPVHSGGWGGPIPDPAQILSKILANLTHNNGKINVPHIYDDVRKMPNKERAELKRMSMVEKDLVRYAGLLRGVPIAGEKGFSSHELIWHRPAISVNAIQVSSRAQVSNVINASAWARIGIRTVPNMKNDKTYKLLADYLKKLCPKGVKMTLTKGHDASWWRTEPTHNAFKAMEAALEHGYSKKSAYIGCGGSIGFVEPFTKALGGAPALLIGVEDHDTNAHSWNESMSIKVFNAATRSMIHFFHNIANLSNK